MHARAWVTLIATPTSPHHTNTALPSPNPSTCSALHLFVVIYLFNQAFAGIDSAGALVTFGNYDDQTDIAPPTSTDFAGGAIYSNYYSFVARKANGALVGFGGDNSTAAGGYGATGAPTDGGWGAVYSSGKVSPFGWEKKNIMDSTTTATLYTSKRS